MSSLKNTCFQINMRAETTLREFAISLVLVISCEPVNVETESRNFSALKAQRVYRMAIKQSSLFQYSCLRAFIGTSPFGLMHDQTVDEDSNNVTRFKYKYKLS